MKKVFLAVIAVIVVLAGGLMLSYNGLAGSKEAVETAEADVDTMLQRRADLIPNLVSTVKSYTKHETEVVDRVLEARDQLMNAQYPHSSADGQCTFRSEGCGGKLSGTEKQYYLCGPDG